MLINSYEAVKLTEEILAILIKANVLDKNDPDYQAFVDEISDHIWHRGGLTLNEFGNGWVAEEEGVKR